MKKKYLLYFLKIAVSAIILFFLVRKLEVGEMLAVFRQIELRTILMLLFTTIIKLVIEIMNWKEFLQIDPSYKPRISEIIKSLFIGHSLRFLIPGGWGTVGKIYYVKNKKSSSFLSIGVEKFFQTWLILLYAAFSSIFYFREIPLFWKLLLFSVIFSLPFLLILLKRIKFFHNFADHITTLHNKIPIIILRQILFMLITIIQYYLLLSLFSEIDIVRTFISVPLILFANVIPITYGGLGLRETFAINVLQKYNIGSEIAVTTTLMIFLFTSLLPALVGLYFIISRKD